MNRSHRYFLSAILLIAACGVFARVEFVPLVMSTDGVTYIESAQFLSGSGGVPHPERLLKPLGPLAIGLFTKIFSGNYLDGFLALNIILYFVFAVAAWYFVRTFFNDDRWGFYGALLLLFAYPALKYGLDYYTDLGSWVLYLVALTGIILYSRNPSRRSFIITAFIVAVGFLWKEYSVLAGVTLVLVLFSQSLISARERLVRLGLLVLIVSIIVGIAQYVVYVKFHFTYLDWYLIGTKGEIPAISEHTPWFMSKSFFAVFLLGWVAAILGAVRLKRLSSADRWLIISIGLPLVLLFFWGYVSSRLYFVAAPLLTLLAVHGITTYLESKTRRILVVGAIILVNFGWLLVSDVIRPLL